LLSIIGTTAILVEILLFCPKLRLVGSWQRAVLIHYGVWGFLRQRNQPNRK